MPCHKIHLCSKCSLFWMKAGCCHILPFPTVIPQYCWWRVDTQLSVVWPRAITFDKITRVEGVLLRGQIRLITRGRATTYAIFENPTYTHTVSCSVPTFSGSKSSQKFVTPQCDLDRQNLHTVREWLDVRKNFTRSTRNDERMNERMNEQTNERMNEWTNEWTNDRMNAWMNEGRNEWTNEWVSEWESEWMNEWMNEWTNEWMNEWMTVRMNEWTHERMNEWTSDWTIERRSESTNERKNERMHEWGSEWVNEWVNEWMSERTNEWTHEKKGTNE